MTTLLHFLSQSLSFFCEWIGKNGKSFQSSIKHKSTDKYEIISIELNNLTRILKVGLVNNSQMKQKYPDNGTSINLVPIDDENVNNDYNSNNNEDIIDC